MRPRPTARLRITIARVAAIALALLALVNSASTAIAVRVLTTNGLDGVRLGMSVSEVERMLGKTLRPDPPEAAEPCWYAVRADGVDAGIGYMIESGRLTRIDISIPRDGTKPNVSIGRGIGIGSTMKDVRRVFGNALKTQLSDSKSRRDRDHRAHQR
jgi:hypothetical protein